jgi:peroxiredoxin
MFPGVKAKTSVVLVEGSGTVRPVEERHFVLPDPIAERDATLAKLAVRNGDSFPDLSLTRLDGTQTTWSEIRTAGRRTLVNVWATYCVPCRTEMPELQAMAPELASAGTDVVGISVDMGDEKRKVGRFLDRLGIHYPNFGADETLFPRIFAGEEIFLPVSFLVDSDGTVLEVVTGWSEESQARIRTLLP